MRNQTTLDRSLMVHDPAPLRWRLARLGQTGVSRHVVIAAILAVALIAFEVFNFDTTRYALTDFLGDVRFGRFSWAAILAFAFCAIDFAGLVRMFTPETGREERREVWYLMGAWLLGATMNAVMTWWAISLTLLNHEFGNEVLGREQLLRIVPVFVAVLVWLTRVLFIGAVSMTGEKLINAHRQSRGGGGGQKVPSKRAGSSAPAGASRSSARIKERRASDPPSNRSSSRRRSKPKPKPSAANRSSSATPVASSSRYGGRTSPPRPNGRQSTNRPVVGRPGPQRPARAQAPLRASAGHGPVRDNWAGE